MALKHGSNTLSTSSQSVKHGSNNPTKVMHGSTLVWQLSGNVPSYHEVFNGFYGYLNPNNDYDDFYTEFRFALPSGVNASDVQKIRISYDIVAFDNDGNYLDDFVNHYDDVIVYNNQTDSISEFTDLGYTDIIVETKFVGNEIVMSVIGANYYGFNGFTGLDMYMVEAYY